MKHESGFSGYQPDLVAQNGKKNVVACRTCGIELGKLNGSHTIFWLNTKTAAAFTILGTTRIELVCLGCGSCRFLRGERLTRMAFQERESA